MKQTISKLSPARIVQFQTEKAIREGRLHDYCCSTYGQKYVENNFCPMCSHRHICEREAGGTRPRKEK